MPLMDQSYPIASLIVSTNSASNAWATITLPAGGAGTYHYITLLQCRRVFHPGYTNTIATIQTSNLNGAMFLCSPVASITDTNAGLWLQFWPPLRCATANTATNIGMIAAGTNIKWNGFCSYYLGTEDQ